MALPPFQPWAPNPQKEPKENLSDLIAWIVESQMRLHDHAMRQGSLLTAIYSKVCAENPRPVAPPFGLGGVAQGVAFIAQNKEAIRALVSMLTR